MHGESHSKSKEVPEFRWATQGPQQMQPHPSSISTNAKKPHPLLKGLRLSGIRQLLKGLGLP